ncbi:hypothetical protein CEXT_445661 [Caerostris extrusa]|uniref:Uncharacterized protein n=1 Tax=Caerostris extrusa TaxID=172846 RepID=A0AAV4SXV4_CAEEX|nr:hypothetical protein CEXT_445661 [Caerostris extrusa]
MSAIMRNDPKSEVGLCFYASTATLIIPSLLWAILAKNLKIKSCGFCTAGFIVRLHMGILDSSTNNQCGFSTTAPYYEGFWFEI